ncbi:hypothetical protein POVWA1_008980 [Plasmodium ovale wallikeri]|uniref:Uncharacterized protein n=1 Tax=Plasmodium ovale wallikeri TaxID=864142 RepID=A0A1A8YJX7_PLAOA|nr:hypothetical protein POVWA1_008980 [Plasmodium ovale wallikeri]
MRGKSQIEKKEQMQSRGEEDHTKREYLLSQWMLIGERGGPFNIACGCVLLLIREKGDSIRCDAIYSLPEPIKSDLTWVHFDETQFDKKWIGSLDKEHFGPTRGRGWGEKETKESS